MKRAIVAATTLAVLGMTSPKVSAGNCEWATAGKVLAGVGAGFIVAKALTPEPAPVVYQQPVVYQPATVVY